MGIRRPWGWLTAALLVVLLAPSESAASEPIKPFGVLDCTPQQGVRFCEGSIATRVPSWDGVPLDVNVTLPPRRDRSLPLVIQLHGYGGSKGVLSDALPFALNNYAVLSYSARGFGHSCGSAASRAADPSGCDKGWIHLADTRYEARDSQYLAGLLADQRIIRPRRVGVMGPSYGGGQSLELAMLRDRVRLTDGSFIPWVSPVRNRKMRIAAAVPIVPWSDLVYALMPNGRTLDYAITGGTDDLAPVGVAKESYTASLFAEGAASGYYAPPGVDPTADLQTWFPLIQAGEPYNTTVAAQVLNEIAAYHSAYYVQPSIKGPAATLIANGFTDDLFPVSEALRWVNKQSSEFPSTPIGQLYFDFGHPRGQNKLFDLVTLQTSYLRWFDTYLKHSSRRPGAVQVINQTCPSTAPSVGQSSAPTWRQLHPGEVRFSDATAQTVASGGDALGPSLDPIAGSGACGQTSASDQAGSATYRLPPAGGSGYTLLGSPTVIVDLAIGGAPPEDVELAARLFDVAPDDSQTLVARGAYRPDADGRAIFQLTPNAWYFAAGHVPKLELVGSDAPFLRQSNFAFTIGVSNFELRLPTRNQPDGAQILNPAPPVLPPGATPVP